jgi:uncharacterized protein YhdP
MGVSKYALFVSMLAMLLPISAAARSDNQRKVNLSTAVQVGSTQLQPGTYQLEWQGNGPAVNVEFIQNGQTVATTQARWVDKSQPAPYDSVVTEKAGNNQNRLMEIDFHKQKQVLQFNNGNTRSGM